MIKEFQSDDKANNQEILDKGFDAQKLSTEEIEKMKKENKDSKVCGSFLFYMGCCAH
jgi:hypothetical protein